MPIGIKGTGRPATRRIRAGSSSQGTNRSNDDSPPVRPPPRRRKSVNALDPAFWSKAPEPRYTDVGLMKDGSIVYPDEYPVSEHPYNKRSVQVRLREEQAYNVAVAKMCLERRFLELAYSHIMYAEELADISQEMKRTV